METFESMMEMDKEKLARPVNTVEVSKYLTLSCFIYLGTRIYLQYQVLVWNRYRDWRLNILRRELKSGWIYKNAISPKITAYNPFRNELY